MTSTCLPKHPPKPAKPEVWCASKVSPNAITQNNPAGRGRVKLGHPGVRGTNKFVPAAIGQHDVDQSRNASQTLETNRFVLVGLEGCFFAALCSADIADPNAEPQGNVTAPRDAAEGFSRSSFGAASAGGCVGVQVYSTGELHEAHQPPTILEEVLDQFT